MGSKSFQVSEEYSDKVKNAFKKIGITQGKLAHRLNLSRSTISHFLNRTKPILKENFIQICNTLKLDWQEIAGLKSRVDIAHLTDKPETDVDINGLVNKLRKQVQPDIKNRCGTMRILDMTQPIGLGDIYTKVNILEKVIGRRIKNIKELFVNCNGEDVERLGLGKVTEEKIPGKEAVAKYSKLLVLGKPGAGKTTFLKHLAIQCIENEFRGDLVPFFVTLKDFAEAENKPGLLDYLDSSKSPLIRSTGKDTHTNDLEHILHEGRAFILLDGLDEVLEADSERVIKEIRNFSRKYPDNKYLMTCRIAAKEYTFINFTEVEIADFDWKQITTFANNWFNKKAIKAETFLSRLKKEEPIQELASNPLLLTLLCITFEESGDFPANRSGLYEEGIDALLKKWDAKRGIKRDQVYQKLWVKRKEDLLSKIAWDTFLEGEYFFKQDKAERYIGEYIRNLPGASNDEFALQLDSEVVLKSIEAQHGLLVERAKHIYSFSHLTFQEYFTAREIITVRQSSEAALQELVSHLSDKRWREVFFLAVGMSPNADKLVLLMKEKIDNLLATDQKIQKFLQWLNEKTREVNITFKSEDATTIKKHYDFYVNIDLSLSRTFYLDLSLSRTLSLSLDQALQKTKTLDPQLHQALKILKQKLPDRQNKEKIKQWWSENGTAWREELRAIMIKYRNIGHDWQFNQEQREFLRQYYEANKFLTQCLHRECYVSREVRQEIEETLLLPISEIEKKKSV